MSSHTAKKRKAEDGSTIVTQRDSSKRSSFPQKTAPPPPQSTPIHRSPHPFGTSTFTPPPNFGSSVPSNQTFGHPFSGFPSVNTPYTPPFSFQPTLSTNQQPPPRQTPPSNLTPSYLPQPLQTHPPSPFGFPTFQKPRTPTFTFQAPLSAKPTSQQTQSLPSTPTSSQSSNFPSLGTSQSVFTSPSTSQTTPQTTPQPTQTSLLPSVPVVPTIRFRIGENGKIHYYKREDSTMQQTHSGSYVDMSAQDFTVFKNAGKRYASNKLTDPDSMQSYVLHSGQFYQFDKSATGHRGQLANDQTGLLKKHQANQLVDRSRADRIGSSLKPFDVGHYKQAPNNSKFDVLSGKPETFGANRDHVVSGESLKRRANAAGENAREAYNQGLAIAIPNKEMHRPSSPTFGGRQTSRGTVDGVEGKRVQHDAQQPALAFYRDATTMLQRTANQNYGTADATLDLSQPENRIRQVGAYRTLFKASIKMNANNPNRGFNPTAPAFDLTHTPKPSEPKNIGSFSAVTSTSGQSQGTALAQSLTRHLKDTGKAK